jgi:hypothetical protein
MIDTQTLGPLNLDVHGLLDWRLIRSSVAVRDADGVEGEGTRR